MFAAFTSISADNNPGEGQSVPGIRVSVRSAYGFILRHHPEMAVYANTHFGMFEASASYKTFGRQSWNKLYNYPTFGWSVYYSDLGKSPYLGYALSTFPYCEIPLIESSVMSINGRAGLGLGYISKPFHRFDNYKNTAIGSHLNAAILLELNFSAGISEKIDFVGAFSFYHFSNGGSKMPNYGINVPAITAGLNYHIRQSPSKFVNNDEIIEKARPEIMASVYTGFKEVFPVGGPIYQIVNFTSDFTLPLLKIWKFGIGLDLVYDVSDRIILENNNVVVNNNWETIKTGGHITMGMKMGRISGHAQLGMYIHQLDKSDGIYYDKVTVFYEVYRNFMLSVTLKTHFAKADYIGMGLAYRIKL